MMLENEPNAPSEMVKLFCVEPDVQLTSGVWAVSPACRLQASNLLKKLLLAVRAFDWERVVVICEDHSATQI